MPSKLISNTSQSFEIPVVYEKVLETEPLMEVLPRFENGVENVVSCLRQGATIIQELDELDKRQDGLEAMIVENQKVVERVGKPRSYLGITS